MTNTQERKGSIVNPDVVKVDVVLVAKVVVGESLNQKSKKSKKFCKLLLIIYVTNAQERKGSIVNPDKWVL